MKEVVTVKWLMDTPKTPVQVLLENTQMYHLIEIVLSAESNLNF